MEAAFYFDLASPLAYFAAERILQMLPGPLQWQPVLARDLSAARHGSVRHAREQRRGEPQSASPGPSQRTSATAAWRAELEDRARTFELQPLRWPDRFPFDSELAMRAATYAKGIGRVVPFAQAAFRQAFAGGHDLQRADFVVIAAAACELHPQAVLRGAELHGVRAQLARTTAQAAAAGVREVPAVRLGDCVFSGADALEAAVRHRAEEAAAR